MRRSRFDHRHAALVAALLILAVAAGGCFPPSSRSVATEPPPATAELPASPAAGPGAQPESTAVATPTPAPPSPGGLSLLPPAAVNARRALAQALAITEEEVRVASVEYVDWPDSCLGIEKKDLQCTQQIVPGYRVIMEAQGQLYEYRTSLDGSQVADAGPAEGPGQPTAALAAQLNLAAAIGVELEVVKIVSVEPAQWPDACLGAAAADEVCAQVITPGYRVMLEAAGKQYEVHTDRSGDHVRIVGQDAGGGAAEPPAISLRRQDAEGCVEARIDGQQVVSGPCGGTMTAGVMITDTHRPQQFAGLVSTFASFAANTAAGKLTFSGAGRVSASAEEQRMIAEWAALVVAEAESGGAGAGWGLGWHREGGIAGLCDDLAIDAGGHASLRSCASDPAERLGWRRLTTDELLLLYDWLDALAPFQHEQKDPAVADAMVVRVIFAGRGEGEPTDADKEGLIHFGADVLARWAEPTAVEFVQAQSDLTIYAGPSPEFERVGELAAGQDALVTGISRDGQWWRVICPDDTVGSCWVSADAKLAKPSSPRGAVTIQPADEAGIYAAVVRQVYTVDHTFAVAPNFPVIYLLPVDDAGGSAAPFEAKPSALEATVQEGITTALADLPASIDWVASTGDVPLEGDLVAGNAAIITLGKIRPQSDGTVQVAASIYVGKLVAGGQRYILGLSDGKWLIQGMAGPAWIS